MTKKPLVDVALTEALRRAEREGRDFVVGSPIVIPVPLSFGQARFRWDGGTDLIIENFFTDQAKADFNKMFGAKKKKKNKKKRRRSR